MNLNIANGGDVRRQACALLDGGNRCPVLAAIRPTRCTACRLRSVLVGAPTEKKDKVLKSSKNQSVDASLSKGSTPVLGTYYKE